MKKGEMPDKQLIIILLTILILIIPDPANGSRTGHDDGKIKIRLRSEQKNETIIIKAVSGKFIIEVFPGFRTEVEEGKSVALTLFENRLACKVEGSRALVADSVILSSTSAGCRFTLAAPGEKDERKIWSGSLSAYHDLNGLLLINECDKDDYIAGVVRAEGGPGKHPEYARTLALITRTYTERYISRHLSDGYNLCDGTHCQVYTGLTGDTMIINAVKATSDMVITTPDSILINSAFHSNCGGETSPSDFVWLTSLPYLSKVRDPFCTSSRNAVWEKKLSMEEWTGALKKYGYEGPVNNPSVFVFNQPSRVMNYTAGNFSVPFNLLRTTLGLRSSWFSVSADGDSLLLRGRGYGHGIGLCQEGALAMALKGYRYRDIISFYYQGVVILDSGYARRPPEVKK